MLGTPLFCSLPDFSQHHLHNCGVSGCGEQGMREGHRSKPASNREDLRLLGKCNSHRATDTIIKIDRVTGIVVNLMSLTKYVEEAIMKPLGYLDLDALFFANGASSAESLAVQSGKASRNFFLWDFFMK